jgi:hypothetical protein
MASEYVVDAHTLIWYIDQIVATALLRAEAGASVALLTRDANITASGLVPIVW